MKKTWMGITAAVLAAAAVLGACGGAGEGQTAGAVSGQTSAITAGKAAADGNTAGAAADGSAAAGASGDGTAAGGGAAAQLENPGGKDGVFTIAYAPNESTTDSADARKGLSKDLSAALGCKVEEIQASDYNAIIEALRTGKADMAYMGSHALALGRERAGLEPIVMKAEDGERVKAVYHSVLVTSSKNADINSIADIKGKTMVFVDPDSTSGNLVPAAEIMKAFPDDKLNADILHTNGEFFEAVSYSGSHQAGLQAVARQDVDIAPVSDQILASEIANGKVKESDIKVIHESGEIPAEAMVVTEQMAQAEKDALTDFLVNYDNADYFKDVIKVPNARFIESSLDDYQDIIELNRIINGN